MSNRIRGACLAALVSLLVNVSLQGQQPAPANQPTAKDVVKAVSKAETPKAPKDSIERIKDEGMNRSQVMKILSHLTDVIGPRLTASPAMKRANEWTRDTMAGWGLKDAHLESWGPFGRGWSLERFSAQVVEPQCIPLIAYPKAWSPGFDAPLTAEIVGLDVKAEADLMNYKGKVKGKAVLISPAREVAARFEPLATRLTDSELLKLADASEPNTRRGQTTGSTGSAPSGSPSSSNQRAERSLAQKMLQFLLDEGAALLVEGSRLGDGGTLFVGGASVPGEPQRPTPGSVPRISAWSKDAPKTIPQIVVSKEHYNRLLRMLEQGQTLKLAVDLAVRFHEEDVMGYNTVAEIPGTDLQSEVVMLGAHLDSWHSGTGATDNAAGVAVCMESMRILQALKLQPKRTIRVGFWTGEEQGLLGSKAYVAEHFGKETTESVADKDKQTAREKFSAYFNIDNGTGKVRGVYLQGNESVRPIFRTWLAPFRDMGATTLSITNTGGTDHLSFDAIGLPGFQFIQDGVEYNTRTHHSNQDLYDRAQADDLKQASVIMAAFIYNTAMRDEKLPRKPASAKSQTPPSRGTAGSE